MRCCRTRLKISQNIHLKNGAAIRGADLTVRPGQVVAVYDLGGTTLDTAHAQDRVRAGARLVLGAVGLGEDLVDDALLARLDALDGRPQFVDDGFDGLAHALAAVPALVAVAKLVRLERAGGCAGGDGRALDDPVVEQHLHFNGRVATRIQDLACAYSLDQCHRGLLACGGWISERRRSARYSRVARERWGALAALGDVDADGAAWDADRWADAIDPYWDDHDEVLTGPAARGPALFQVRADDAARVWHVRQVLDDPAGDHDWRIDAVVDLAASDEVGEIRLSVVAVGAL